MGDGFLQEIIALEHSLQADLEAEQRRIETWRQQEIAALEADLSRARGELQRAGDERRRVLQAEAEVERACLMATAEEWCRQLQELTDETLRDVLSARLGSVLGEADDDHPHGQS